jgi:hypothetical protein
MASGHVNRTNRPNTWLHRPSLRRDDSSCQPGAVHTCAACAVEWNISPWLGFEVDYQFELRRLLDRQVNGPFALEYPPQDHPDARVAPAEVRARPGPTASGMRCFVVGRDRREHIDRCGLTNGERRVPFS